jgi:hypothetical protein
VWRSTVASAPDSPCGPSHLRSEDAASNPGRWNPAWSHRDTGADEINPLDFGQTACSCRGPPSAESGGRIGLITAAKERPHDVELVRERALEQCGLAGRAEAAVGSPLKVSGDEVRDMLAKATFTSHS